MSECEYINQGSQTGGDFSKLGKVSKGAESRGGI